MKNALSALKKPTNYLWVAGTIACLLICHLIADQLADPKPISFRDPVSVMRQTCSDAAKHLSAIRADTRHGAGPYRQSQLKIYGIEGTSARDSSIIAGLEKKVSDCRK